MTKMGRVVARDAVVAGAAGILAVKIGLDYGWAVGIYLWIILCTLTHVNLFFYEIEKILCDFSSATNQPNPFAIGKGAPNAPEVGVLDPEPDGIQLTERSGPLDDAKPPRG